jgi:hypothetical protein
MKTPPEVYELSARRMPSTLCEHSYPEGYVARSVRPDGGIKWQGQQVFVGEAFSGEQIGVEAVDDGLWHLHFGPLRLGVLRTVVTLPPSVTHVPGHECHPCSRLHSIVGYEPWLHPSTRAARYLTAAPLITDLTAARNASARPPTCTSILPTPCESRTSRRKIQSKLWLVIQ